MIKKLLLIISLFFFIFCSTPTKDNIMIINILNNDKVEVNADIKYKISVDISSEININLYLLEGEIIEIKVEKDNNKNVYIHIFYVKNLDSIENNDSDSNSQNDSQNDSGNDSQIDPNNSQNDSSTTGEDIDTGLPINITIEDNPEELFSFVIDSKIYEDEDITTAQQYYDLLTTDDISSYTYDEYKDLLKQRLFFIGVDETYKLAYDMLGIVQTFPKQDLKQIRLEIVERSLKMFWIAPPLD